MKRTRIFTKAALAFGLALAAPVASARAEPYIAGYTDFPNALRVADQMPPEQYIAGYTDFPNSLRYAPPDTIKVSTPTLSETSSSSGFDWGDAGVGAGAAAAALLLVSTSIVLRKRARPSIS